jgi:hypothetical protein
MVSPEPCHAQLPLIEGEPRTWRLMPPSYGATATNHGNSVADRADRTAIVPCDRKFAVRSANRTASQVDQPPPTQSVADLAQLRARRREKLAEPMDFGELL